MCHCLDCQRRAGGAFSVAVFSLRGNAMMAKGAANSRERGSASGLPVHLYCCGTCGSEVFWEPRRLPDPIDIAIGAFADPKC